MHFSPSGSTFLNSETQFSALPAYAQTAPTQATSALDKSARLSAPAGLEPAASAPARPRRRATASTVARCARDWPIAGTIRTVLLERSVQLGLAVRRTSVWARLSVVETRRALSRELCF